MNEPAPRTSSFDRVAAGLLGLTVLTQWVFVLLSPLKRPREGDSMVLWLETIERHWLGWEPFDWNRFEARNNNLLFAVAIVPASLVFVTLLVRLARKAPADGLPGWSFTLAAALSGAAHLINPRLLSSDVNSYIAYGRLATLWGYNPVVFGPEMHPDVFSLRVRYMPFRLVPSAYGPTWLRLSEWVTRAAEALGGQPAVYVLLYRGLALAGHLGCVVLVDRLARVLVPERRALATAAYAVSPLVIYETAWNTHNDVLMLLGLLAALYLAMKGHPVLAGFPLGAALFLKWVPAVLVPSLALHAWRNAPDHRRGFVRAFSVGLAALSVGVIAYVPYYAGAATLGHVLHAPSNHFTINSLADLLLTELRRGWQDTHGGVAPESMMTEVLKPLVDHWKSTALLDWSLMGPRTYAGLERGLRMASMTALAVTLVVPLRRVKDVRGLADAWAAALFVYATFAAVWFWPWYLVWVIGTCVLASSPRGIWIAATYGLSGQGIYFTGIFGGIAHRYRALVAFVPALVAAVWPRRGRQG